MTVRRDMTVGELREIINDPDIPDNTPLRLLTRISGKFSSWEWELTGAHGTLAGEDRNLTQQLDAHDPALAWTDQQAEGVKAAASAAGRIFQGGEGHGS
jgi:hypothetical protein